jgi:hypothetical protein
MKRKRKRAAAVVVVVWQRMRWEEESFLEGDVTWINVSVTEGPEDSLKQQGWWYDQ